jgi:hypothetical protein
MFDSEKLNMALKIAVTILLLFASTAEALAGYKSNYSDWKQTSPEAQSQYAMGLLDGQLMPSTDDKADLARSFGLNQCAVDLGLTGLIIAEAITRHYENHSDTWGMPPIVIFQKEIVHGACLQFINAQRTNYGLELWK